MTNQEKLIKLYNEIDELSNHSAGDDNPEFIAWRTECIVCLSNLFGENSVQVSSFKRRPYCQTAIIIGQPKNNKYFLEFMDIAKSEFGRYIADFDAPIPNGHEKLISNRVFIVHGHDELLKTQVARLLEQQEIETIILSEKANEGRTLIQKLEAYSDVSVAIALFTNDDLGNRKDIKKMNLRARQNVVFEAGFFIGQLGREKVVIIAEDGIEMPSDLAGVVYTSKDHWEIDVLRELRAAGINVDLNRLL